MKLVPRMEGRPICSCGREMIGISPHPQAGTLYVCQAKECSQWGKYYKMPTIPMELVEL